MLRVQSEEGNYLTIKIPDSPKKMGRKIISLQSVLDQHNHAWTYLCRGIMKPWSVNLRKWTEALLIFLGSKKLGQMN